MSLLVVGSTAFDTIETPHGNAADCLGGSSTYFALAARLFTRCAWSASSARLPAEAPPAARDERHRPDGRRDEARQDVPLARPLLRGHELARDDRRAAQRVRRLPAEGARAFRTTPFVFLANGAPATQASVLDQMQAPRFCVADTMDLWIERERDGLLGLLRRIDGLIVNDSEVKQLTGKSNLIQAGRACLQLGPKLVIVKKGEHGCFVFSNFFHYALPAYPTEHVVDPTGAGDSFAGGFMGYLANCNSVSLWNMKRAVAYGTCAASLTVEGFGVQRLADATLTTLERRYHELQQFVAGA
jgi:hypothetical protein